MVSYLDSAEADALLAAPDLSTRTGRRDRTLIALALQAGLRVSELAGLRRQDVSFGKGAHVHCTGKGRKERCTPLTSQSSALLRDWMDESGGGAEGPLFPGPSGKALSRDAVAKVVARHVAKAGEIMPLDIGQKDGAAHPTAYLRDAALGGRRRRFRDRPLARSRVSAYDRHLPTRQHGTEGTCPRVDGTRAACCSQTLQATRLTACVPGVPVIMPTTCLLRWPPSAAQRPAALDSSA